MSKRPYYAAFGLLLVLTLVLLNLSSTNATRVKLVCGSLFIPLFGLAGSTEGALAQAGQYLLPRSVVLRRLKALDQENAELRFRVQQLESVDQENERLRSAVEWAQRSPWKLKAARVVARDPANWWRSLQVDLGSRDGVEVDVPVLTSEGVVGRVVAVAYTRSQVLLAGDPNCRFAAQVAETRAKGIISPNPSSLNRLVVDFTYAPIDSELAVGQSVITSGDGGVFPKDMPVGRILSVQTNEYGLYLEAQVRLAVDLNRVEEVWLMIP